MALIGGGGAGNVAGGNPSGTGTGLNYIGEHAYANSGVVEVDTNFIELLNFSTGNNYIMAKQQIYSNTIAGADIFLKVSINSELIIASAYNQQGQLDPTGYTPNEILIPPQSTVKIEMKVISGTANLSTTVVGRVY